MPQTFKIKIQNRVFPEKQDLNLLGSDGKLNINNIMLLPFLELI